MIKAALIPVVSRYYVKLIPVYVIINVKNTLVVLKKVKY